MRDVALRASVSAKTVSRVFNDDPHVSPATRLRVRAAMDELGFVPNLMARTFRSGRDMAIGVAVPDVSDPFFANLTRAIEAVAAERGCLVVVASLGNDPARERAGLEALLHRHVVGLVAVPTSDDQSYLAPWMDRTPVVFVDRAPSLVQADTFVEDDHGGALAGTRHLLLHGHRRIVFAGDALGTPTTRNRLRGYRDAHEEQGVAVPEHLVRQGHWSDSESPGLLGPLLLDGATAVFSSNARCTLGVVHALHALRRTDVALVSFGDVALAAALQPALTALDQDPSALGTAAATRVFERLDDPGDPHPRTTVLPVTLLERGSGELPPPAGVGDAPLVPPPGVTGDIA
ncbi:LacI family DNA-binding transcriptional regulator [Solicola sp. PLA-1-18]|uniref:LacI family DNA-binding transcriptional regulator n=1 Tax=Solicola sp. PLA-1-18 TaxID=3380532 RepID=UPI003B7DD7B0